jgi:uncharacterized protein YaiI (UPF0178 family)
MPVKEEIVEIATEFFVAVVFIGSYDHYVKEVIFTYETWKYVDSGKEAKDLSS